MKINVFYHCYLINNWREVVTEQFDLMHKSGLYDECEQIHAYLIGGDAEIQEYRQMTTKLTKVVVKTTTPSNVGEFIDSNGNAVKYNTVYNGIRGLSDFSKTNDSLLFYLHTKGTTQSRPQETDWRNLLNYFNITRYKDCATILRAGKYNCAGINCSKRVSPHFSGNIWWTTSDYAKTLRTPPQIFDRFYYEFWIGESPNFNPYSFHSSHPKSHHSDLYPTHLYMSDVPADFNNNQALP